MIHEFQSPFFQPLHMRDMMDAKNINYKSIGHTPHEPIEINKRIIATKFGTNCDILPINKVYVNNIDETLLYEQLWTMPIVVRYVSFIEVAMMPYTPTNNPRNVTKNILFRKQCPFASPKYY